MKEFPDKLDDLPEQAMTGPTTFITGSINVLHKNQQTIYALLKEIHWEQKDIKQAVVKPYTGFGGDR